MMAEQKINSDLAIPPGEYLDEILEDMEISQADLARRMGRPAQAINEIIKGEKAITPETAIQLEQVLGVSAQFWSNMESIYRLVLAKQKEKQEIEKEVSLLDRFPYMDMSNLGIVEKTRKAVEKVQNLRRFFGVSSLTNIEGVKEYEPAFRVAEKGSISHEATAAWLKTGSNLALKQKVEAFDKELLKELIPFIRGLSLLNDPNEIIKKIREYLNTCGVAFVVIPHYKKTYITGATFWYEKKLPVVMMSMRGSWSDIFWFSLFHEIAHILLHDKRMTFLEGGDNEQYRKQENEADKFSEETLISSDIFSSFLEQGDISPSNIISFSESQGIHPGIVTGRLQRYGYLSHKEHYCRVHYKWEK
ncbi:HTH-type transcriptional regulator / antitoxin HigA [Marinomonas polaris DSM 16579]|uniref:HTH-type transcriptional regulator / antitoxin HigA n=1 Tax=Marinomonas polaris DSM 16579 TaxID=1122206 RepID=A0A1M5I5K4_9GAMM|nr:HigA family addiction module antitoxin [Marinomonas polaris]SHG23103.1 HTH-type transcriptional regulator / antitoxin HigA [Marinomonas polaris DSM 16579]